MPCSVCHATFERVACPACACVAYCSPACQKVDTWHGSACPVLAGVRTRCPSAHTHRILAAYKVHRAAAAAEVTSTRAERSVADLIANIERTLKDDPPLPPAKKPRAKRAWETTPPASPPPPSVYTEDGVRGEAEKRALQMIATADETTPQTRMRLAALFTRTLTAADGAEIENMYDTYRDEADTPAAVTERQARDIVYYACVNAIIAPRLVSWFTPQERPPVPDEDPVAYLQSIGASPEASAAFHALTVFRRDGGTDEDAFWAAAPQKMAAYRSNIVDAEAKRAAVIHPLQPWVAAAVTIMRAIPTDATFGTMVRTAHDLAEPFARGSQGDVAIALAKAAMPTSPTRIPVVSDADLRRPDVVAALNSPAFMSVVDADGDLSVTRDTSLIHLGRVRGALSVYGDTGMRKLRSVRSLNLRDGPASAGAWAFPLLTQIEDGVLVVDRVDTPLTSFDSRTLFPRLFAAVKGVSGTATGTDGTAWLGALLADEADIDLSLPGYTTLVISPPRSVGALGSVEIRDSNRLSVVESAPSPQPLRMDRFALRNIGSAEDARPLSLPLMYAVAEIRRDVTIIHCPRLLTLDDFAATTIGERAVLIDTPASADRAQLRTPQLWVGDMPDVDPPGDPATWKLWRRGVLLERGTTPAVAGDIVVAVIDNE
jgi:hypothetical protein